MDFSPAEKVLLGVAAHVVRAHTAGINLFALADEVAGVLRVFLNDRSGFSRERDTLALVCGALRTIAMGGRIGVTPEILAEIEAATGAK